MRDLTRAVVALALAGSACTAPPAVPRPTEAPGPRRVDMDAVARHQRNFDAGAIARRPAGSQQEKAAATYVLAHLQRAGYTARLEAVPVADTVNSTDVIALPPSGEEPEAVVAVPYDTGPGPSDEGAAIGLFLELARALRVVEPRHSVEFVGLGAERAEVGGGSLGSRRLARLLVDADAEPLVVTIESVGRAGGSFGAFGGDVGPLEAEARRLDVPVMSGSAPGGELAGRARIFRAAGLDHIAVTGGAGAVGRVLLAFLQG